LAETPLERGLLPRHHVRAFLDRRGRPALARSWPLALGAILLFGGLLRFHGLDWDQPEGADDPLQMHPDERFLSLVTDRLDWPDSAGGYFDTSTSPLNPYNDGQTNSYVYGTFPLFLVKAVATIAGDDPEGARLLGAELAQALDRAGRPDEADAVWATYSGETGA